MTTTSRVARVTRLEDARHLLPCPTCHDAPRRYAYEHPETGECWQANMPPTGCPTCGLAPLIERIYLIDGDPFPEGHS